jgi:hypothetical protein
LNLRPLGYEPKVQFDFSEKLAGKEKEMLEAALGKTQGWVVRTVKSGCQTGDAGNYPGFEDQVAKVSARIASRLPSRHESER